MNHCAECGGPADTLRRNGSGVEPVCFKDAGPVPPGKPAGNLPPDWEARVTRIQEREAAEAAEELANPRPPKERPEREVKCVDCGTFLDGRQRKRCAPCAKTHQREYFNEWRGRRRAAS